MSEKPTIVLVHGFWGGAAHWSKVILALSRKGFTKLNAVELPLTSLADDAERTRKMVAQQSGPVLLVGHSYGGAVITEAGDMPNVVGLVYIAAFVPDAGESPGSITQSNPPAAIANVVPDSDGYLWIKQDAFHESFCQDLTPEEGLIMGVTQKAPLASTFGDNVTALMDLSAGRLNAVVVDEVVGRYYVAKKPDQYAVLEDNFGTEEYGVGLRKDDTELLGKLDKVLADMKADGAAAKISEQWFGKNIVK